MIKTLVFAFMLLFSLSTNSRSDLIPQSQLYSGIDPTFVPYIKEFIELSNGKVTEEDFEELPITFKDYDKDEDNEDGTTLGTCYYGFGIWPNSITINRKWWNAPYTSESERWEILYHELGHCVLSKDHTYELTRSGRFQVWLDNLFVSVGIKKSKYFLEDGCPISIMHPYSLPEKCIIKHYPYYIKEVFED